MDSPMRLEPLQRQVAGSFEYRICHEEEHHGDCVVVVCDVVCVQHGTIRGGVHDPGTPYTS
jgi:hypothetical protein